MTHYRIIEHRCSDGKSTFYVEYKGDHWWSCWSRAQRFWAMDYYYAEFNSLDEAKVYIEKLKVTCQTIIHEA